VFQNRRWDADFLTLRKLIAEGALGEVMEFHSHFDRYRPVVADRWRERDEPGSGLWYDLGPHLLDQALQLFGMPEAVFADIALQRDGARVADYFNVLLRYPKLRVVLHAGSLVAGQPLRFAVHGTRASYLKHGLDPQEDALRKGGIPGQAGWGIDPLPGVLRTGAADSVETEIVQGVPGDYVRYYAAMRDAILHGGPAPVTPQEALQVMAMLEWGLESSATRREVVCR
jgi:predicted dehydrogenase